MANKRRNNPTMNIEYSLFFFRDSQNQIYQGAKIVFFN